MDNTNREQSHSSPAYFDQVEFLLSELNHSSDEINSLERELSDAISRRTYLMDSISGPRETVSERSLYVVLFGDPVTKSSEYYKVLSDQGALKNRIQTAVESYKAATSAYESARNHFDELADSRQRANANSSGSRYDPVPISSDDQLSLSHMSLEVLAAQANRDSAERSYMKLMHEFDLSLAHLDEIRKRIGDQVIKEAALFYERIEIVQKQIYVEDRLVETIRRKIEITKERYKGAMLRLEEVSTGIRQLQSGEASEEDRTIDQVS